MVAGPKAGYRSGGPPGRTLVRIEEDRQVAAARADIARLEKQVWPQLLLHARAELVVVAVVVPGIDAVDER